MQIRNKTSVVEFIILGFPGTLVLQYVLFMLLLLTYVLTILCNSLIMIITWTEQNLHKPMYFYLRNFSMLEIFYVSVTVPKVLDTIRLNGRLISVTGCIAQLFFFIFLSSTECVFLAVMAVDRYLAICHPLHYPALMNTTVCQKMCIFSWCVVFATTFPPIFLISQLPFCSNAINHFFCDASPLLKKSCVDTYLNDVLNFFFASSVIVTSFTVTLFSYLYIITTIRMPTRESQRKAFSTCASHLTIVLVYYGTVTFIYVRPKAGFTFTLNRAVGVFYIVITPVFNPIVYCLRNKEVKNPIKKFGFVEKVEVVIH